MSRFFFVSFYFFMGASMASAALSPIATWAKAKETWDVVKSIPGLPFEANNFRLKFDPIGRGQAITLGFVLELPPTQKMPTGAPAYVSVHEKLKGEWQQVAKFNLKDFFFFGDSLSFSRPIVFAEVNSEIAVHATIYHCGKNKKTPCYIQGYQGTAKRKKEASSRLSVTVKALAPDF